MDNALVLNHFKLEHKCCVSALSRSLSLSLSLNCCIFLPVNGYARIWLWTSVQVYCFFPFCPFFSSKLAKKEKQQKNNILTSLCNLHSTNLLVEIYNTQLSFSLSISLSLSFSPTQKLFAVFSEGQIMLSFARKLPT